MAKLSTSRRFIARRFALASAVHCGLLVIGQGCQPRAATTVRNAQPRDYHFSASGNDLSGTGSAERPFRSIVKATALRLNPGDRLLFQGGQTFNGNLVLDAGDAGTDEQPVSVGSFGGGRATIEAGLGTGVRVENAGGVSVADLVVVGTGPRSNAGNGVEFANTLRGGRKLRRIRVERIEVSGFGREGVFVHGAPADGSASGYDDVLISDCVARQNAHTGVYVTGRWVGKPGRQPEAMAHTNVRVVRCLAEQNPGDPMSRGLNRSGSGILLDSVDGGVVEYCEASANGADNRARSGGPVGIWCTVSNRIVIQFCKSHRNRTGGRYDGGGFCLDGGVSNSVLRDNISEENDGSGFGLYEYAGAPPAFGNAVLNNISRNDGRRNGYAGIHVWDDARSLRDVRIEGNRVELSAAPSSGRPPRGLWMQSAVRNVRIADNQFIVAGSGVRLMDIAFGQRDVQFERNAYRTGGDAIAIEWPTGE